MSRLTGGTAFGTESIVLTQSQPVGRQLELGIRLFDIRPVIGSSRYVCGHYSKIDQNNLPGWLRTMLDKLDFEFGTWQGGNGQFLDEIVGEVNRFTERNAELVILDCTRWCGFNTDTDNKNYRWFNREEWDGALQQLSRLNHLFKVPAGQNTDLTNIKMKDFIGDRRAAVICVVKDDVELGPLANQGFFKSSQFRIPENRQMSITREQGDALENVPCILNDKRLFDNFPANILVKALMGKKSFRDISVRGLAASVKSERLPHVVSQTTTENFPNQIWIDDVDGPEVTRVAVGVIKKICQLAGPKL
ncbi:PLC-like phosphodiesterase [Phlyctema vagabunda]|uniref:PLC-like phosphodiesterase n=1 Tax=Phlyctema vagabunda TaxID=108571 RepID=A0ABR4PDR9_9HELO